MRSILRLVKVGIIFLAFGLAIIVLQGVIRDTNTHVHPSESHGTYGKLYEDSNSVSISEIENVLRKTRTKIEYEMQNYNFQESGVQKLNDLLMNSGGNPVRNLIVSAWRSGSTFLGELFNAMPSNFYHYEPLLKFHIEQIRGPPHGAEAIRYLKKMLMCDFSDMEDYFEYGKTHLTYLNQFKHNARLWEQCNDNLNLCFNGNFTSQVCRLFPFQSMKVVRFRLDLVKDILDDKRLGVKVVLLVRDPRAVLQSRRYRNYCRPAPDCIKPELVCADMVSDYVAARRFMQLYPGRVRILRFEDIALNLKIASRQLFKFLRLEVTPSIEEFLQKHTNAESGGVDSTFRDTKKVPFKWKNILDFDYVRDIQIACINAMQLWGYKLAFNASHMASDDFYPLDPYFTL